MCDRGLNWSTVFGFVLASNRLRDGSTARIVQDALCAWQFFVALAVCFAVGGCDGNMKVAPVSGTVTLDGEPLEQASVLFQPEKGRPSFGVTDSDGKYSLTYSRDQTGAEVGECTVKISTAMQPEEGERKPTEKIPERYAKQPIKVQVEPTRNTIDIKLARNPS